MREIWAFRPPKWGSFVLEALKGLIRDSRLFEVYLEAVNRSGTRNLRWTRPVRRRSGPGQEQAGQAPWPQVGRSGERDRAGAEELSPTAKLERSFVTVKWPQPGQAGGEPPNCTRASKV